MKRKSLFLSMAFFGILACTESATEPLPASNETILPTTTAAAPAMGKGFAEMITGSGHFVTGPLAYNPGVWRTFTMTAKKARDGTVEGKFQINLHVEDGPPLTIRGPITCFTIVGNKAWIGAEKPGNDPADIAFQVVDNGEGDTFPADQVGLYLEAQVWGFPPGFAQDFCDNTPEAIYFGPPFNEDLPLSMTLSPVVGGNIQIHSK